MPVQTQWFKDRLAERRMSQRALARAMNIDQAAVSLMFRGRREMRISEAIEIAHLLGRAPDEVMEAAGVDLQNRGKRVQISGCVDGTGEVHAIEKEDRKFAPFPASDLPTSCHAVECRTSGTSIDFMNGWLLFVDSMVKPGIPAEAVDRLSICKLASGIMYLAKPTRGYGRNRWHLNGPAASAQDVEVEWANPVLLIQT